MTARTSSSAATTSAGASAIAPPSASPWSWGRAASRKSAPALEKEVEAERWTSLDRALRDIADDSGGVADLRPGASGEDPELRRLMLGRAAKLERLGLAEQVGPARWTLKPGLEPDAARPRHPRRHHQDHAPGHDAARAMSRTSVRLRPAWRGAGRSGARPAGRTRAARRAEGTAYAIIDGVDGRTHHLTLLRPRDDRRRPARRDRRGPGL